MKVEDFVDYVGEYLQEDFSVSPVWSKTEIIGYLQQVMEMFGDLTGLVDKNEIRLIDETTGEAEVPRDFHKGYFAQHELRYMDTVQLGELDFVSGGWLSGNKGTPRAVSLIGSGGESVVRYVPVPSSVWDGGYEATPVEGVTLQASGGGKWYVSSIRGVIETTAVGSAATTAVIPGPSSYWDLKVDDSGVLYTEASASTTASNIALRDTVDYRNQWWLLATDEGVLYCYPVYTNYGLAVGGLKDYVEWVDFNQEYGIIVDAYAAGGSESLEDIIRLDSSRGVSLYAQTSTGTGMVWYKGSLPEVVGLESVLWLNDGFVPVVVHGVLSLAFNHDGDGRDLAKARLLGMIFTAECQAIKESFQTRWA
jgi:hypothetical protein